MPDNVLKIELADEHFKAIAKAKPANAICELLWNSLDADAGNVEISFIRNEMSGLESIVLKDDGTGIKYNELEKCFKFLGKSPKTYKERSDKGRIFHGKNGEGRYQAFCLGKLLEWNSIYEEDGKFWEFSITTASPTEFPYTEPKLSKSTKTGVTVSIKDLTDGAKENFAITTNLKKELITGFAHYLKAYEVQDIKIIVDGELLDLQKALIATERAAFTVTNDENKEVIKINFDIYHWHDKSIKKRYFCSKDGVVIHEDQKTGLMVKDFGHSIYLSSDYFDHLHKDGSFVLQLTANPVFDSISSQMDHFVSDFLRKQLAEKSRSKIQQLKSKEVYPYKDLPENKLQQVERDFFDICASKLIESSKNFLGGTNDNQKLLLELLKNSLEKGPDNVVNIMREVVKLPEEEINNLKDLINRHSLSAIIKVAREVSDRISFLSELNVLLFDKPTRDEVLERRHLHAILENEIWIFGDEYELGTSDKTLKELLRKHVSLLDRKNLNTSDETINFDVEDPEFKKRPDLFIYRQTPQARKTLEHLVIELKRPSLVLSSVELNQIKTYARRVSGDQMFDKDKTNWNFIIIAYEFDEDVSLEASQTGRPKGLVISQDNFTVSAFKWSEILHDLTWRYAFIKQKIDEFDRSPEDLTFINQKYGYLFDNDFKSKELKS